MLQLNKFDTAEEAALTYIDRILISLLLRSMRSLSAAISATGLRIQVSTPHSLGILSVSKPPSSGRFSRGYDRAIIGPILDYHQKTKTPFLILIRIRPQNPKLQGDEAPRLRLRRHHRRQDRVSVGGGSGSGGRQRRERVVGVGGASTSSTTPWKHF
ncbi:Glucan endo-1,3-beta-glucosidase 11 [Acorus gramineus]|uniref:Glucan endo-1,3-beta-glucosidase 11 n=1 Tax=Acorus gramineus TaxID=55184 RepID=A0AAV9AEW5_ACOGR|nr:Glucan endo-1,3-beta-glucosidase 11 [Acorus gramineus]